MFKKSIVCLGLLLTGAACTKDFDTININPNTPSVVPLDYLLGESELFFSGAGSGPGTKTWRPNFGYAACLVQQMSSIDATFYKGSFYTFLGEINAAYFENSYTFSIKSLVNLIDIAQKDAKQVNVLSMARILRVMEFARITDIYGDVPYSEAGKGFISNTFSPKYDAQKDIYFDMLKELDEASKAFSATAYVPKAADYFYAGDLEKWKRSANSLMLRLAMRMQKVDPASAQTWAKKAIDGGLIGSNAETIAMQFSNTGAVVNSNPNSWILGPSGQNITSVNNGGVQWAKTLIDMMKTRKDPRLPVIASLKNGDRTVEKQRGLPNATDATGLNSLAEKNLDNYSRPAPNMYDLALPWIYMTYAEAQLLKAEAIERGWATGTAKTAFDAGQAAGLTQMTSLGGTISAADVTAYTTANPYPASGTLEAKMNAIHTEIYLITASTLNHIEGWSNWRRTGYPVLTPVNYVGNDTNGQIPRRLRYPLSENGVNSNFQDAITRQGPDLFTTRIWWDK
ncbi:SusD/RagB family nutrient-binding outer membrane lipoprotein [soil metagenome]